MSLGEAVRYPVDKFVIASALILFFTMALAAPTGLLYHFPETGTEAIMISGVLFIAAAVGKFVTGLDVLQKGIGGFHTGSGMTPMGETGLISTQMGLV